MDFTLNIFHGIAPRVSFLASSCLPHSVSFLGIILWGILCLRRKGLHISSPSPEREKCKIVCIINKYYRDEFAIITYFPHFSHFSPVSSLIGHEMILCVSHIILGEGNEDLINIIGGGLKMWRGFRARGKPPPKADENSIMRHFVRASVVNCAVAWP